LAKGEAKELKMQQRINEPIAHLVVELVEQQLGIRIGIMLLKVNSELDKIKIHYLVQNR
jgi:ABC-type microcin C transport system permease subunit YejB